MSIHWIGALVVEEQLRDVGLAQWDGSGLAQAGDVGFVLAGAVIGA